MRYWMTIFLLWLNFWCPFFWCCSSILISSSKVVGNALSNNVSRILRKFHVLISSSVSSAQSEYFKSLATLSGTSQWLSCSSFILKMRTNANNAGEMYRGAGNTVIFSLCVVIPMLSNSWARCLTNGSDWLSPKRITTLSDWLFSTMKLKYGRLTCNSIQMDWVQSITRNKHLLAHR